MTTMANRTMTISWGQMIAAGVAAAVAWLVLAGIVSAASGTGFWSPWILMAALVSRNAEGLTTPADFQFPGVTLGFVVQLILSAILAVVFGAIAARFLSTPGALIGGAVVFGLAVFLVLWYVGRPGLAPESFELSPASYAVGYIGWGVVLGLLVGRGITFR